VNVGHYTLDIMGNLIMVVDPRGVWRHIMPVPPHGVFVPNFHNFSSSDSSDTDGDDPYKVTDPGRDGDMTQENTEAGVAEPKASN
jgi:hypothetical protein